MAKPLLSEELWQRSSELMLAYDKMMTEQNIVTIIESSAMFVRGGVYRVVKEAMGGTLAKLSVSALLFDYVLTALWGV